MARGWAGKPPRDDDEARERIIDAAMRCIVRNGPDKTGSSDLAGGLGVTSQTVYWLYKGGDDLQLAEAQLPRTTVWVGLRHTWRIPRNRAMQSSRASPTRSNDCPTSQSWGCCSLRGGPRRP